MKTILENWAGEWSRGDLLAAAALALAALTTALALLRWVLRRWLTKRRRIGEFGTDLYLPEEIANATRYYVRPDATSVDLAQEMEEGSNVVPTREDLFRAVERFIDEESKHRHLLLLADAGMGKSSFVLNYYAHNRRKYWGGYKLAVIPLGHRKALEKVKQIERPKDTILFLDAFDEDPEARDDYAARLDELMEASSEFRRVLITCRTQFFPKDAAIPRSAGPVFAPRTGEARHSLWRLYLAPFSDRQIDAFLRRRFWVWEVGKKRRARAFARKVPKLTVRPMLLAHLPDLLQTEAQIHTSWELYEVLTDKWCAREKGFWEREGDLRKFSEEVAVHFYLSFLERGADRVPREVVTRIVEGLKVSIEDIDEWKATSRSLLHRDAEGNWKFAHRSVMEFLFLKRFFAGDARCRGVSWTDQMKQFVIESATSTSLPKFFYLGPLAGADLTGIDLSRKPLKGANLAGADLSWASFDTASLVRADLGGSNLTEADLRWAGLDGANLTKAILNKANLTGAQLYGATLSGASLVGARLSKANLIGVDLRDADLTGASIREATLSGADAEGADLSEADLIQAKLTSTTFTRARLVNARLSGADLNGADLTEADLSGAHLSVAQLQKANLTRANLRQANLYGADLTGAHLLNADLTGAALSDAVFKGAYLAGAVFSRENIAAAVRGGADLTGVNLGDINLEGLDFSGVVLAHVDLAGASLRRANFREAKLNAADLTGADLTAADLSRAYLYRTGLGGARLGEADLSGTDLTLANLRDADLGGAKLAGACLTRASLRRANLTGADLSGARLEGTDLTSANLDGADLSGADLTQAKSLLRVELLKANLSRDTKLPHHLRDSMQKFDGG